jgi:type VI secretion system secreted protein VgrG
MVLADDPGKHTTLSGYETVPYYAPGGGSGGGAPSSSSSSAASPASRQRRERDHLEAWSWTKAVQPGSFATTDFDFEKPRKSLSGTSTVSRKHGYADYEIFDYPAELTKLESSQSDLTAKVRIQEFQASYLIAHGHGNAAGLGTGLKFKLDKYPRKDLNIDYLITQCTYTLTVNSYETGAQGRRFRHSGRSHRCEDPVPARAAHAQAGGAGCTDRHGRRQGWRGDLH